MDQAAVVALPPKLAPLKVIADGVADWQATSGPPALTLAGATTLIVTDPVTGTNEQVGVAYATPTKL